MCLKRLKRLGRSFNVVHKLSLRRIFRKLDEWYGKRGMHECLEDRPVQFKILRLVFLWLSFLKAREDKAIRQCFKPSDMRIRFRFIFQQRCSHFPMKS